MTVNTGPNHRMSMTEAVQRGYWTEEEKRGFIERDRQRQLRKLARDAQREAWGLGGDDEI